MGRYDKSMLPIHQKTIFDELCLCLEVIIYLWLLKDAGQK